ncbi:MAG: dihydroorotate dehydrogenase electron transfer subunit [Methanomassiliicoccales archaeon]|jgi:dihydroorotate dehydrogenase electron transfer subunit|nr:dihydroorotate dehydrogenase electron transfer subunit [Methanomassiliicoccales archaeon]
MHKLTFLRIKETVIEGKGFKTLRFIFNRKVCPGQFVMVWIPGVDEIPMSLSYLGKMKGITVREVGESTKALGSLEVGDSVAIRGPFGRGFERVSGKTLLVCGGAGAAAILPIAEEMDDRERVDIAIGARTKDELIFGERSKRYSDNVRTSTDDGSEGHEGTVVDLAKHMMEGRKYDFLLACGPESMLISLLKVGKEHGVSSQFSLERFMRCGVGICGSCVINGKRVCTDGPVFWGEELESMSDFGRFKRDESGQKIRL